MSVEPEHDQSPQGETSQANPTLDVGQSPRPNPEPSPQESASEPPTGQSEDNASQNVEGSRPRIKIGTQRPGVAAPKVEPRSQIAYQTSPKSPEPAEPRRSPDSTPTRPGTTSEARPRPSEPTADEAHGEQPLPVQRKAVQAKSKFENFVPSSGKVEPPNLRQALSPDLEEELQQALGDTTLDELIAAETGGPAAAEGLEPESQVKARVLRIFRDNVFVDLGGRNQGVLSFHQLPSEPEIGAELEVVVNKFNVDDGLYEVSLTGASVDIGDWSDLSQGITVDARITGHNKGGLECEVNKIRGFIPAGQISIYRVENFEEFVGQTWPCVVVEANPDRRNLVLSRRAILEREQAEAKEQLLKQLQVGDVREGVVRSIRDFGAFVDLGGVDGLVHVSQMSWDRVKHPSEVLEVGQRVKVKVQKIDPETRKISLAYRDLFESPWVGASTKYPVSSKVKGTVSKIMDFGAFVKLEPGIEGLVHISELSHKRVFRVSDVLKEADEIEAKVLSIDIEAQRISLSMRALEARPEPPKKAEHLPEEVSHAAELEAPKRPQRQKPLKGGLGRSPMGEKFGLQW